MHIVDLATTYFFQANVMDEAVAVKEYILKCKYYNNKLQLTLLCLGMVAFISHTYRAQVHMNRTRDHLFERTQAWLVKCA